MKPEHEAFMLAHVEKMGFMFIIDCLKDKFPDLSHKAACAAYTEFRAKHAEDETMKAADAELRDIGKQVAAKIEAVLPKHPE